MTAEYSRISDTARAVDRSVLPRVTAYLESIRSAVAGTPAGAPYVIADYGAADGANSSRLFESIIGHLREINPSLKIRLVYIDIADPAAFDRFWAGSSLSRTDDVEAVYLRRSFYEPFPELAGCVNLGFSSTALHWLDTQSADADLFRHPACIQANQLPEAERGRFAEKWRRDWRAFFSERSRELVGGGLLFLANLTSPGEGVWPASAAYNTLRDLSSSLYREGRISQDELRAIFIPGYFATPDDMRAELEGDPIGRHFSLVSLDAMTVPCAYFARMGDTLEGAADRRRLARLLARAVRAWSESSIRVGLSVENAALVDEIYRRLEERFFERPEALPYQYCLIELVRRSGATA